MAPIRIGFIGLSKSGWASRAHQPYLKNTDKYQIVAIQNSSAESAKESIKFHGLPETTKAYGNPEDIANDPDVELIVSSVRVDRHKDSIVPSLKAGKDVFIEWPLGKSLADAEEILSHKKEGTRTFVGLQARQSPLIDNIRDFISSGKLGDVLSSTWQGHGGFVGSASVTADYEYLADKKVGGNLVTIVTGHTIDYVQQALGSTFASANALLANRRPFVKLLKADGTVINDKHPKTAEDTLFLHGTLSPSPSFLSDNVPVSFVLRGGQPFKGTPGLDWRILGTKGELRITASSAMLQIGTNDTKVEFQDAATNEVEEVKVTTDAFDKDLPIEARNVARVYEAIAAGADGEKEGRLSSFEDAVERHRFLESF